MQLPGNETHQKILQLFINLFQNDKNIQAFILFGSLVKGNWDNYSDLDLDAVVINDNREIVQDEVKRMLEVLTSSGFKILIAFEEFPNEQVIILDSLDRISIRFHLIENTIPHILDSCRLLYGVLKIEDITKSIIKPQSEGNNIEVLKDKFIELSIYVPIALHRNQLINAEFFLNKMRNLLIEIYTKSRAIQRFFDFERIAEQDIKEKIQSTFTTIKISSMQQSHITLVTIFTTLLNKISNNKLQLTKNERLILNKVLKY